MQILGEGVCSGGRAMILQLKRIHGFKIAESRPSNRWLRSVRAWLAMLILFIGFASPAIAQLDTGSISGVVTDPAGKVVQGAAITATEPSTGTTFTTVSSSAGYYVFPSLRTGTYVVKVESPGFKSALYSGVVVGVGATTARDIALTVGSSNEVVTVVAGTVSLEKETSDINASISPQQVEDLPLAVTGNLRSLTSMEFLVPGTVGPGTSSGGSGFQMTKINGGQEEGTDYLVDGITTDRMENGSGSVDILTPSVDAVNEFQVSLSGLPAELGRTTGGLANFNTKSGSNNYHGVLYNFYKNAALDANNWFNNGYLADHRLQKLQPATHCSALPTQNLTLAGHSAARFAFHICTTAKTRASSSSAGSSFAIARGQPSPA